MFTPSYSGVVTLGTLVLASVTQQKKKVPANNKQNKTFCSNNHNDDTSISKYNHTNNQDVKFASKHSTSSQGCGGVDSAQPTYDVGRWSYSFEGRLR